MPAMAQGPLEEPPGPVSPGWCPARKAATVSSLVSMAICEWLFTTLPKRAGFDNLR